MFYLCCSRNSLIYIIRIALLKTIRILELVWVFVLKRNYDQIWKLTKEMTGRHRERDGDGERWRHTSHISKATIQLSLTTLGASGLLIHSFKCGSTSGVAIPPSASAASCRTISCSEPSCNTRSKAGTEWGERSWPKTKAISCLENMWHLEL